MICTQSFNPPDTRVLEKYLEKQKSINLLKIYIFNPVKEFREKEVFILTKFCNVSKMNSDRKSLSPFCPYSERSVSLI